MRTVASMRFATLAGLAVTLACALALALGRSSPAFAAAPAAKSAAAPAAPPATPAVAPAAAAKATAGEAPQVPHMSRAEALAYLEKEDLALEPSNLVRPLLDGDAELVEALLSAGVNVNDKTELPQPALQLAAGACAGDTVDKQQILVMIEVLLAHGAKVNDPHARELSPLMVAAQHCPAPVVRRLLRAGADREFRTSLGLSPLSMALLLGNYDAAEALLEAGARLTPQAASKLLSAKPDDARLAALVKRARRP